MLLSTALCFSSILLFALSAQIFPSVLSQIPGTAVEHGLLLFALFLFFPVAAGTAGFIADRIGKKRVLIGGALLMSVTFLISAFVHSIWFWILSVLFFGIGSGVVEGQASAKLTDLHRGRENQFLSASQSFYSVGAIIGPFYIIFIFRTFSGVSLQTVFLIVGLINLLLVLGLLFLKEDTAARRTSSPASLPDLLRDRHWRIICAALFIYVAEEAGTAGWLEKYSREVLGISHPFTSAFIAVFWLGIGVSRALIGFRILKLKPAGLVLLSIGSSILFRVVSFAFRIPALAACGILFLGISLGAMWPSLVSLAGIRFRGSTGAAVGAVVAAGGLGAALIQPVVGFLSAPNRLGLRATMLLLIVFPLLNLVPALCLAGRWPFHRRERAADE